MTLTMSSVDSNKTVGILWQVIQIDLILNIKLHCSDRESNGDMIKFGA